MKYLKEISERKLIKYFILSCFATLLDIGVTFILLLLTKGNLILINSIAMAVGFAFQFIFGIKHVFNKKVDEISLVIYIVTFFIGIFISNLTLYAGYYQLNLNLKVSKIFSIITPFIITYKLRSYLIRKAYLHMRNVGDEL